MKKNIIILLLILAFICILVLLDLPTYNKVALLRREIKNYKDFLTKEEELMAKVNQLKEVYDSRRDDFKKAYYSLPPEKDIPGLIVQFEALASENGLILESLNFIERTIKKTGEAEEEKKDYKSLAVFLSLTGNYKSFENFLKALELNVRLMDIKSIEFSSEKIEEEGIFNFNVDLEVYCQ